MVKKKWRYKPTPPYSFMAQTRRSIFIMILLVIVTRYVANYWVGT